MTRLQNFPDCKVCGAKDPETLLSTGFLSPPVWDFLEAYYRGRLGKELFEDAKFQVSKCRGCGFIWQANILGPEGMGKLYGDWIVPEESLAKKKSSDFSVFRDYALQVQTISLLVGRKPVETEVLDFGMGWGFWCLMAKAHGFNVRGLEISKDRIAFARGNGIDVREDIAALSDRKYDFINTEQVFEHLDTPRDTIDSIVALLKPGGFVRISVPDGSAIEAKLRQPGWKAAKDAIHPLEHINCFTHASLVKLGETAGLKPVRPPVQTHSFKSLVKKTMGPLAPMPAGTTVYFKRQ
ncbi:MAG: Methyltransferase type 11 [Fibrobacteres bacterium]|nr:Methyltransferase type 11 [Fibrobacterota bacterium]